MIDAGPADPAHLDAVEAAAGDGKQVMLFGVYGGAMRGSASECTLVIGDEAIQAPPIVPHCWSVIAMHPLGLAPLAAKLRPDRGGPSDGRTVGR